MVSQEEKNRLLDEFKEVSNQTKELRNKLNNIALEKENWHNKKEELSSKIKDSIGSIKSNKQSRDTLTAKVKEHKQTRGEYNKQIALKIEEIKKLNTEKKAAIETHKIEESPFKIKSEIDKIEFQIETEVMPFDKEKKLMDKI